MVLSLSLSRIVEFESFRNNGRFEFLGFWFHTLRFWFRLWFILLNFVAFLEN